MYSLSKLPNTQDPGVYSFTMYTVLQSIQFYNVYSLYIMSSVQDLNMNTVLQCIQSLYNVFYPGLYNDAVIATNLALQLSPTFVVRFILLINYFFKKNSSLYVSPFLCLVCTILGGLLQEKDIFPVHCTMS